MPSTSEVGAVDDVTGDSSAFQLQCRKTRWPCQRKLLLLFSPCQSPSSWNSDSTNRTLQVMHGYIQKTHTDIYDVSMVMNQKFWLHLHIRQPKLIKNLASLWGLGCFFVVELVIKTLVYSQQMESAGRLKTTDRRPWSPDLNPTQKTRGELENKLNRFVKLEPEKSFRG